MASLERRENRAVIKFCRDLRETPTEAFKMIQKKACRSSVSRALVFKWYKRFTEAKDSLKDRDGSRGKPKLTQTTLSSMRDALDRDRRLTVRELSDMSKVLRPDLVYALQKRPGVPLKYYLLYQDNASVHTAASTTMVIGLLGLGTVLQPPYSPDLVLFDFSIFPTVLTQLKGHSLHELKQATSNIIAQYGEDWYGNVFEQWVHKLQKCIEHDGEYFENRWSRQQPVLGQHLDRNLIDVADF